MLVVGKRSRYIRSWDEQAGIVYRLCSSQPFQLEFLRTTGTRLSKRTGHLSLTVEQAKRNPFMSVVIRFSNELTY